MDIYSEKKRSEIMSKIKGRETKLEEKGWALLNEAGVRFRKHPKGVYGRPDAGHKGKKIAVFFDSEFWHGYDWKNRKKEIKSNQEFWIPKIVKNIERDQNVTKELEKKGWRVIRIWGNKLTNKSAKPLLVRKIRKIWSSLDK